MEEESVSARALAESIGVQRKSIFLWRNGRCYPRYDALIKLAFYFETSAEYLLGLSDISRQIVKSDGAVDCVKEFKTRLTKFVMENNYTRYRMAKLLGVGRTVFNRWLNKGAIPEVSNLIKLSLVMNETIEYILGIED